MFLLLFSINSAELYNTEQQTMQLLLFLKVNPTDFLHSFNTIY